MRFLRYWAPPLVWAALIFASSEMPRLPGGPVQPGLDKVLHLVAYAVQALLWVRALGSSSARQAWLWALVLSAGFGALDEFHQRFVPQRECSFWDWVADLCGAGAALMVAWVAAGRNSRS